MKDHLPLLLLAVPLMAAPFLVLASFISRTLSRFLLFLVLAGNLALLFYVLAPLSDKGFWPYNLGGWAAPWGIELALTPFTALFAGVALLVALATWFYGLPFWVLNRAEEKKEGLLYFFLLLSTAAFLGILLIRDTFSLYLLLEISMACAAALLVAGNRKGWLDGFRFFLWGSTGASFFLLGLLLLYSTTGTFQLEDLLAQLFIAKNDQAAVAAGVLITLGLTLPFCFPSPRFFSRLVERTPPFILGFLSSVFVRGSVYLLFIFLFFVLNIPSLTQPLVLTILEYFLAILFFGDFIYAARQKDFHQAVAFLSVAQLGYLFVGFLLGNKSALTGTLIELISQVLVVAGLFFIASTLRPTSGAQPFSRLAGLARHRPLTGLALIIFTASIVGVPPTGGSFGKWYLIQGALERKDWVLLAAVVATILFNLVYFTRLMVFLYEHRSPSLSLAPPSLVSKAPMLLLAAGVLLLGIFHQDIIHNFIEPTLPKAFLNSPLPNVPFLGKQVE